ncbi:hypothetical protein VTK26DRAFT_9039 [Humicola hyalothermophila]
MGDGGGEAEGTFQRGYGNCDGFRPAYTKHAVDVLPLDITQYLMGTQSGRGREGPRRQLKVHAMLLPGRQHWRTQKAAARQREASTTSRDYAHRQAAKCHGAARGELSYLVTIGYISTLEKRDVTAMSRPCCSLYRVEVRKTLPTIASPFDGRCETKIDRVTGKLYLHWLWLSSCLTTYPRLDVRCYRRLPSSHGGRWPVTRASRQIHLILN